MKYSAFLGFTSLLLLLFTPSVQAEGKQDGSGPFTFGATLGVSAVRFVGDGVESATTSASSKTGFTLGAAFGYDLHELAGLQAELLFATKGSRTDVTNGRTTFYTLSYIDLPLVARMTVPIRGRVRPFLIAGPTLSFLLTASLENSEGEQRDIKDVLRILDIGLLLGTGATLTLSPNHWLGMEARYGIGFRNIDDAPGSNRGDVDNRALSLLIRYEYRCCRSGRPAAIKPSPEPREPVPLPAPPPSPDPKVREDREPTSPPALRP